MAVNRYYSSTASRTQLGAPVTSSATVILVGSVAGFPASVPFTLLIDPGLNTEEIVTVASVSGLSLTVVRGQDGSSATAHDTGAVVIHGLSARDLREPQEHIAASTGVHGLTGPVAGTSDVQTLTNKSLDGGANTFTNVPKSALPTDTVYLATAQTLTNKTLDGASNTFTNLPKSAIAAAAAVVYLADTQTLTNKSIDGATNTLTNIPKSALPTDTFYLTDSGQVTTGITTQAGWGTSTTRIRKRNGMTQVNVKASRTGTDLTVSANGGLSDENMQQLPSGYWPTDPVFCGGQVTTSGGSTFAVTLRLGTDGMVVIVAASPGITIDTGSSVFGTFTFIN